MIIGFDIDDVLFPWVENILEGLKRQTEPVIGPEVTVENWVRWNPTTLGCSEQELWDRVSDLYLEGFLLEHEPYQDAIVTVARLHSEGHEIRYVTARSTFAGTNSRLIREQTLDWLLEHGFLALGEVSFTKPDEKISEGCDWFIDDNADTVHQMRSQSCNAFLMDRPWNRHAFLPRVYSLQGYADQILRAPARSSK